ncbi:MAG: pirin family protein [Phycisphaera sp.]|nr:pirin family protein [Phycisphaera sp.]
MLTKRNADERGRTKLDWLNGRHSFSFGRYYDPAWMGFGPLRVINDDVIAPSGGFGEHPHRDMEIITYILDGALEHRDSMGNGSVIRPGDVQVMTAGSGIRHSEFNALHDGATHLLQIWIEPGEAGLTPRWDERTFDPSLKHNQLHAIVTPDGRDGSLLIRADATIYAALLSEGKSVTHAYAPGRRGWVQVARGKVTANGETLSAGDGAALTDVDTLTIEAADDAEVLVFDLP